MRLYATIGRIIRAHNEQAVNTITQMIDQLADASVDTYYLPNRTRNTLLVQLRQVCDQIRALPVLDEDDAHTLAQVLKNHNRELSLSLTLEEQGMIWDSVQHVIDNSQKQLEIE